MKIPRLNRNSTLARCLRATILPIFLASTALAAGPVVLLIGGPGSGRTTQAEKLAKDLGMAIISADDLIAHNQQLFEKFKHPAIQGVDVHLDPALNGLVEDALQRADLSKGVVIDGYPAAKTQADFLTTLRDKLGLPKPVVIHLHVPDEVSMKRLAGEKGRDLEHELNDYHRELDFAHTYFPQADIHDIDGTKKPDEVAKAIRKLLGK